MILQDVKIKGLQKDFKSLESLMKKIGFVRWSWDYQKVTYDFKYTSEGIDYYLRVRGNVINKRKIEHPKAILELETPVFARHYFPHGLDDTIEIPNLLQDSVQNKLSELESALNKI